MSPSPTSYVQRLPGVELTIEKATGRTPDTLHYHVFQGNQIVGSFRGLPRAQELFRELRDASGWTPPKAEDLPPEERLLREKAAKDRLDYLEYWSSSHQFRGGGRPRRRQR